MTALAEGSDGRQRCWWGASPEYVTYHDEEWGRPVTDDRGIYERLTLEAFQSGLSWLTILRKRENFRRAFDGFEIEKVADYGNTEFERLMSDAGIVRNRKKIEAAIANANAARELHAGGETLDELIWGFAPDPDSRPAPESLADVPPTTPESTALAKELKKRGFAFVGPTTMYALMEAIGIFDPHLVGCHRRRG